MPPFQIDGITSQEFTYAELKTRSIRYAECLQAEGVREGDVVGLCSENRIDFTSVLFGTMYLGATVAPINLTYSESKQDNPWDQRRGPFIIQLDFHSQLAMR